MLVVMFVMCLSIGHTFILNLDLAHERQICIFNCVLMIFTFMSQGKIRCNTYISTQTHQHFSTTWSFYILTSVKASSNTQLIQKLGLTPFLSSRCVIVQLSNMKFYLFYLLRFFFLRTYCPCWSSTCCYFLSNITCNSFSALASLLILSSIHLPLCNKKTFPKWKCAPISSLLMELWLTPPIWWLILLPTTRPKTDEDNCSLYPPSTISVCWPQHVT